MYGEYILDRSYGRNLFLEKLKRLSAGWGQQQFGLRSDWLTRQWNCWANPLVGIHLHMFIQQASTHRFSARRVVFI